MLSREEDFKQCIIAINTGNFKELESHFSQIHKDSLSNIINKLFIYVVKQIRNSFIIKDDSHSPLIKIAEHLVQSGADSHVEVIDEGVRKSALAIILEAMPQFDFEANFQTRFDLISLFNTIRKSSLPPKNLNLEFPFFLKIANIPASHFDIKLLENALRMQPELFQNPEYKIKLLNVILRRYARSEHFEKIVAWIDMAEASKYDLIELLITALRLDIQSIFDLIMHSEPTVFKWTNERQKLDIIWVAYRNNYRTIIKAILDHPINFSLELINTFESPKYKSELLNLALELLQTEDGLYDVERYSQLENFFEFEFLNEIKKFYVENKSDGQALLESHLLKNITRNGYHLPDETHPLYQLLKQHNLLSADFEHQIREYSLFKTHFPKPDFELTMSSDASVTKLLQHAIDQPQIARNIAPHLAALRSIQFFDNGGSVDTWWSFAKDVINRIPAPKNNYSAKFLNKLSISQVYVGEVKHLSFESLQDEWSFLRIQGRTVLLRNKSGEILALKIKKQNEAISELNKEFYSTRDLKAEIENLQLQSFVPTPKGVIYLSGILSSLKNHIHTQQWELFIKTVENMNTHAVYLYTVDQKHTDYFTYLHDLKLTEEQFAKANEIIIADLCKLLGNGVVYHQLADIFHNSEHKDDREDRGRYIVLANLLSPMALRMPKPMGSGRLTGWDVAVEYPNVRGTGLADWGDYSNLSEYLQASVKTEAYYAAGLKTYKQKVGNFLIANIVAEYQYVLFLVAGRRARNLDKQMHVEFKSEDKHIWQKAAKQVVKNCAQTISHLTSIHEKMAQQFLSNIINVDRLARQMQFWMTDEYIAYVGKNDIPEDIYGENVNVLVDVSQFRAGTFNKQKGCSIDGIHPDLGPVNGQEPIKENNKLLYWMVTIICSAYHQERLTQEDLTKIIKEDNPLKSEALRLKSFTHLTKEKYHYQQYRAGLFTLCKQLKKHAAEEKVDFAASNKTWANTHEHRKNYLAMKYFNRWTKSKESKLETHTRKTYKRVD